MPDTRSHRGAHPDDAALFGRDQLPGLRSASGDLWWLLDHGYAVRSSLALVGDRYGLTQRQRIAVARCASAASDRDRRIAHQVSLTAFGDSELWLDGYNLLISIEAALSGGVILFARDGCYRDLASLHGTYRAVEETLPAIELIGNALDAWSVKRCRWLLDRPVSNSGRLKETLLEKARSCGRAWDVQLEFSPDALLCRTNAIVASSDSAVLDQCDRWANVARAIISTYIPDAFIVDLHDANIATPG